ncbi:MAG: hypothetical protein Kilf2KO_18200 [Rhodospirillales bacterium]
MSQNQKIGLFSAAGRRARRLAIAHAIPIPLDERGLYHAARRDRKEGFAGSGRSRPWL